MLYICRFVGPPSWRQVDLLSLPQQLQETYITSQSQISLQSSNTSISDISSIKEQVDEDGHDPDNHLSNEASLNNFVNHAILVLLKAVSGVLVLKLKFVRWVHDCR